MFLYNIPRGEKTLKKVLSKAEEALRMGEVIYFPTDTLPALLAWASMEEAVLKVFKIKKRPFNIPMPLAVKGAEEITEFLQLHYGVLKNLSDLIPGPLTIVAPLKRDAILPPQLLKNGEAAFRVPDYRPLLLLLEKISPLTLTSANLHKKGVLFHVDEALNVLGGEVKYYFVDYYHSYQRTPSTVVRVGEEVKVLRAGVVSEEEIRERLNG